MPTPTVVDANTYPGCDRELANAVPGIAPAGGKVASALQTSLLAPLPGRR